MAKYIVKIIGKAVNIISLFAPKLAAKTALNLFATPRKGKYTTAQYKSIKSASQSTLSYLDYTIAVYHWNTPNATKTILLAHGWESNASRWHYIITAFLEQGYQIIALDAPAHGQSSSKYFNAVLYSEFINKVAQHYKPNVLIGHSVGGMACIFALYHFNLPSVTKLVTLGAPSNFTDIFNNYKTLMGYNNRVSKGLNTIVLKEFNHPVSYFSSANFATKLNVETLVIHDKGDRIIPFKDAEALHKAFKNANLITTEAQGHGLKAPVLTPKIIAFIERSSKPFNTSYHVTTQTS